MKAFIVWHMADKTVSLNVTYGLDQSPPAWILLVPADSVVAGRDGRRFTNPGPARLIQAFDDNKLDVVVDLEHSSQTQALEGKPAPAFGWIGELEDRDGALFGKVDWTEAGIAALARREYRYYSPAYKIDDNNLILRIVSVGLTNTPNLRLMSLNQEGGDGMDKFIQDAKAALGLNNEATETEVLAKIKELGQSTSLNSETLVPKADLQLALNRAQTAEGELATIRKQAFATKRDGAIDAAVTDGKIAPASKEYYKTSCNSEEALTKFVEFTKGLAPIVGGSSQAPEKKPGGENVELNSEQLEMAARLGISAEDALKFQKENR